ncbi:MAG TPA: TIM barrel protein [Oscillospiraceae bacterium]|mgnify:CR=1 FL=1|nr:TIM barrel protein [Oscillospiraceae bacterium]HPK35532.1 TIM barrel protein [Oscillospiraceae bacterium]HPR75667.1 TIM barrel protein [Oscillospiraceae bacterium]
MKTGYHAVYAKDYIDGIDAAKANGFDFVQFDLGVPEFFLDRLTPDDLTRIREHAEEKEIDITFHSPGDNVSLFCDYPLIRQGILDQFKRLLEKADMLNARHMTFHTGDYPRFRKAGERSDESHTVYYEAVLYENLKMLIEAAGDVLVCVENTGLNAVSRSAVRKLINDTGKLFLTLDTAKMYKNGTLIQDDYLFFEKHELFLREMHIHDINQNGSHEFVGSGTVDFPLFKQFVNENVWVNFEIRPVEAAKISKSKLFELWGI